MSKKNIILTIAGSDSSGGAGIQADIKAISALGAYAASVITALTAQNTQGVQAILDVPAKFVEQQLMAVFSDLSIHAVKIGMLHNQKIIKVILDVLEKFKPKYIVLDPVMCAKNGSELLERDTLSLLKEEFFPRVSLITPNLPEAEKILGTKIKDEADMHLAATTMGKQFKTNVLIKGGHLVRNRSSDILFSIAEDQCHWFHGERIMTPHTHGTGCTLSSAISTYLAQGFTLHEAIFKAKEYLTKAIQSGSRLQIGQGRGPLDHFFNGYIC